MKARVIVTIKKDVLDPQGKAIEGALSRIGFKNVNKVRQGKVFDLELAHSDCTVAEKELREMCKKLLANSVIEDYHIMMEYETRAKETLCRETD